MTTRERVLELWDVTGGNLSEISRRLGITRQSVQGHVRRLGIQGQKPLSGGKVLDEAVKKRPLPTKGSGLVHRYIITSAQNNTHVHGPAWENILALAEHWDAEILVGTFSYNVNAFGKLATKRDRKHEHQSELWYAEEVEPYIVDDPIELAPGLQWRGEMNILPTAVDPLNGFETYKSGRASAIFPHVKFAMRSIAGAKHEATKFTYTTGTVTQRNYVQKRAGLRAEHHHCYGALIVEVNAKGEWWVRQLNADSKGDIYDLDLLATGGEVGRNGNGVEALTLGDLHSLLLEPEMLELIVDMRDELRPNELHVHDVLLGAVTNHHESKNPHERFRRHMRGGGWTNLTAELQQAVDILEVLAEAESDVVVVDSNHDRPWIERWLRETDYRQDPENALLFLRLQLATYEAIASSNDRFHLLEHAMIEHAQLDHTRVRFLREDESHVITPAKVECGWHGHLGPNGSRGNPAQLAKIGRKANTAHTHAAGIWDGLYVAAASCSLDMGYNRGPSSWSNSHVVTYPNGKRTVVTVWDGRWRA